MAATGKRCVLYHAGMASEERRLIEKQIEERAPQIVIATSAFGMGMDHPHLRWALLWQAPPSLLSLAQAIGRAGRDPLHSSRALIFWEPEDFRLLQWMLAGSARKLQELQEVRNFLEQDSCRIASLKRYFSACAALVRCNQCSFCNPDLSAKVRPPSSDKES